jgi:elongation factor Ts
MPDTELCNVIQEGTTVQISAEMVKELREKTGAGIMDAKRALEEVGGDMEQATQVLHKQGLARAEKKTGRQASQGLVEPYIHGGGRIGTLVEVNCETDFVARTPDFQELAHNIAMQIAALNPQYINEDDVPEDVLEERTKELGDRTAAIKQLALMSQDYIKDGSVTIEQLVKEHIARLGENIVIRRFSRFELGEGEEHEQDGE